MPIIALEIIVALTRRGIVVKRNSRQLTALSLRHFQNENSILIIRDIGFELIVIKLIDRFFVSRGWKQIS